VDLAHSTSVPCRNPSSILHAIIRNVVLFKPVRRTVSRVFSLVSYRVSATSRSCNVVSLTSSNSTTITVMTLTSHHFSYKMEINSISQQSHLTYLTSQTRMGGSFVLPFPKINCTSTVVQTSCSTENVGH
jgi:hypothetical protein